MATWNYRVVQFDGCVEVREVYYDNDGNVFGHSEAAPLGNTVEELRAELEHMQQAFDRPTLTDLPET